MLIASRKILLEEFARVWHRDSHFWKHFVGGVHKIQILIRENLEEILRNLFGEEIGGSGGLGPPNVFCTWHFGSNPINQFNPMNELTKNKKRRKTD